MSHEREIAEEQEFLDVALEALDAMRQGARSLRDSVAVANMRGAGDLVERDVVMGTALHRLDQLAIGDQPLFFGRIDYQANGNGRGDTYHVGRLAVSDESLNPSSSTGALRSPKRSIARRAWSHSDSRAVATWRFTPTKSRAWRTSTSPTPTAS